MEGSAINFTSPLILGFIGNRSGDVVYLLLLLLLPASGIYFATKDYKRYRAETQVPFSWRGFFEELRCNDMVLFGCCFWGWGLFFLGIIAGFNFSYWPTKLLAIPILLAMSLGAWLGRFGEQGLKNQLKIKRMKKKKELKRRRELEGKESSL